MRLLFACIIIGAVLVLFHGVGFAKPGPMPAPAPATPNQPGENSNARVPGRQ